MENWREILIIILSLAMVYLFFETENLKNSLAEIEISLNGVNNSIEEIANTYTILKDRINENRKLIEKFSKKSSKKKESDL